MKFKILIISIIFSGLITVYAENVSSNKITPVNPISLESCKISSLPPYYRDNCTKSGGKIAETFSMGYCGKKKICQCSYFTCITGSPKTTAPMPLSKSKPVISATIPTSTKILPTTLSNCITYSLPPNFSENCTKNGGVVTDTYSAGYCQNKKICRCSYSICSTSTAVSAITTKITSNINKIPPSSLSPCVTYSLPSYFKENCVKSGGKMIKTFSKAYCRNNEECQCPYFTCIAGIPKTTMALTTNENNPTNLSPCITYSLPPHFKENCTKSGGRMTETYSMAYCRDKKVCQCPYFTCINSNEKTTVIKKETITVTKNPEPTNDVTGKCIKKWGKCGGIGFNGPSCCESGLTCHEINKYFSQCI